MSIFRHAVIFLFALWLTFTPAQSAPKYYIATSDGATTNQFTHGIRIVSADVTSLTITTNGGVIWSVFDLASGGGSGTFTNLYIAGVSTNPYSAIIAAGSNMSIRAAGGTNIIENTLGTLGNLAYSNSATFIIYLGNTYLTIAGAGAAYYPLTLNPAGYVTNGTPIALSTLPSAGVSGMVTNPIIYFANGIATNASSAAEAAGGSSLSWQRWEQHASGVDLIKSPISNNWGFQEARIADGTRYIAGAGAATYYSNATQLAELMVTFRANALKTVYSDTNNTLAFVWWVVGVTNSGNASWLLKAYGNQEGSNGAITNSVLIYSNTTAYVTDAASGIPTFTAVPMSSLFNTNLFPSYTFDIFPTLLATNPANVQAIYFGPMGGGM